MGYFLLRHSKMFTFIIFLATTDHLKTVSTEKANVSVKFYFTMESLVIELFAGDADNVSSRNSFSILNIHY